MERLPDGTTTERLVIRLWRPDEAPVIVAAVNASLDHLRPWMAWASEPATVEHYEGVIAQSHEAWRGGDAMYGVFLDGVAIGGTGLHRRAGPDTLEIGYWIHADHISRGYATEISAALTDLAFSVEGIEFVEIHHDGANVRSAAVPRKLGFVRVAIAPPQPLAPAHAGVEWSWRIDRATWPRRVWFAGRCWSVKRSATPVGPGDNRFDDSLDSVAVADGALVLRIRPDGDRWTCAEVVGVEETGYGRYEWSVASDVRDLDAQAVLGMFTWSDDGDPHHRELDVEVSGWGAAPVAGQFVVAPREPGPFAVPATVPWRCSIYWAPGRVMFQVAGGSTWNVTEGVPTAGGVHPRINLWLDHGEPPKRLEPVEVRLTAFRFTPVSPANPATTGTAQSRSGGDRNITG